MDAAARRVGGPLSRRLWTILRDSLSRHRSLAINPSSLRAWACISSSVFLVSIAGIKAASLPNAISLEVTSLRRI